MKFKMIIENNVKTLHLTPDNAGEAALLASCAADAKQDPEDSTEAQVYVEWSADRHPYKKAIGLKVVL